MSKHVHIWKKMGTNADKKNVVIRSWSCRCRASKVRRSEGTSNPRATVSRIITEAR